MSDLQERKWGHKNMFFLRFIVNKTKLVSFSGCDWNMRKVGLVICHQWCRLLVGKKSTVSKCIYSIYIVYWGAHFSVCWAHLFFLILTIDRSYRESRKGKERKGFFFLFSLFFFLRMLCFIIIIVLWFFLHARGSKVSSVKTLQTNKSKESCW